MSTISRGTKNAFRNPIRTVSIVLILSLSFGLALAMLLSLQAVSSTVSSVSSVSDTTITVSQVGGFFNAGNPLTEADVSKIKALPHVSEVAASVTDRLAKAGSTVASFGTGGTTSLTSPLTYGSLGTRRFGGGGAGFGGGGFGGGGRGGFGGGSFTPPSASTALPVGLTGTNQPTNASVLGATTYRLTSGTAIDGMSSAKVADVGSTLATKNALKVGSTFTAYGENFTVSGIFSTSSTQANAGLVIPLKTAQTLSNTTGVTNVTVTVDDAANVASTTTAITNALGAGNANVTSAATEAQAVSSSLSSIKTISIYALVGALIAAAVILLLSMLMVVRERRREIGIVKAFGSSNGAVVGTFTTEALTLTVLGGVVGTVVGIFLANPVLSLLKNSTSSASAAPGGPGGFGGAGGFRRFGGFAGRQALSELHTAISGSVALYTVLGIIVIAVLGSAVPAYLTAKVRPAEVLRGE